MLEKFSRDIQWVTIGQLVSRLASVITVPILTNELAPENYGIYRTGLLLLAVFTLAGYLNIKTIPRKRLPEISDSKKGGIISAVIILVLILLLLSYSIVWILSVNRIIEPYLGRITTMIINNQELFFILFLSNSLYNIILSVISGLDKFRQYTLLSMVVEMGTLALVVSFSYFDIIGVITVLWILSLTKLYGVIVGVTIHRSLIFSTPDFSELISLLNEISLPLVPQSILKKLDNSLPQVLIVWTMGAPAFAIWSVTMAFQQAFLIIGRSFSRTLLPKLSSIKEDEETFRNVIKSYYKFMVSIITPGILGGWVVGKELIIHIFGSGYFENVLFVGLIISGIGLQTIATLCSHFFITMNESQLESYTWIASSVVYLLIAGVGSLLYQSLVVIALGFALSRFTRLAISIWYQNKFVDISTPDRVLVGKLLFSLVILVITTAMMKMLIEGIITAVLIVGIEAVIYFSLLYLTGYYNREDLQLVVSNVPLISSLTE